MAKISALPLADPLDGSEDVPIVQGGQSRRINPADHLAYLSLGAEMARDQAADLVNPQNIFVDIDRAAAEAAVAVGTMFKLLDSSTGLAEIRKRSEGGSSLLYREATTAALGSPFGSGMIGSDDGDGGSRWTNIQEFIAYLRLSLGSSIIGFLQGGAGAVQRFVAQKLGESVSPMDFGAAGDADPTNNMAGTDDSAAVQKALDYCATHPGVALHLCGRFYKVMNVRIPPRGDRQAWYIYGKGGGFVHPATATSEAPCLFYSSLANSGDASRSYTYSPGVKLFDVKFWGAGHGVGYAHLISGGLIVENCVFRALGDGVLTIGATGISLNNCMWSSCKRAVHAALLAEYAFTANYTQDAGYGWNDGYHIRGGSFSNCDYGLLYKGSTSEGVVSVTDMVWTGATESYVQTHGATKTVHIAGNWCEYTKADANGDPHADIIRFLVTFGGTGESPGRYLVERNHFFLSSANPVGGINTYAVNYIVNAKANVEFRNNVVTASTGASGTVYTGCIWNDGGHGGAPFPAVTITPANTDNVASAGHIRFNDSDLAAFGQPYSVLYMRHDNGKTYLLTRRGSAGGGATNYDIHPFSFVWSPQFPPIGPNWINSPIPWTNRIKPIGVVCDFTVNATGLTAPAGNVTVWSGLNGGVTSFEAGAGIGAETLVTNNVFQNFDMTRIYQQREFGRVRFDGNIKRA